MHMYHCITMLIVVLEWNNLLFLLHISGSTNCWDITSLFLLLTDFNFAVCLLNVDIVLYYIFVSICLYMHVRCRINQSTCMCTHYILYSTKFFSPLTCVCLCHLFKGCFFLKFVCCVFLIWKLVYIFHWI